MSMQSQRQQDAPDEPALTVNTEIAIYETCPGKWIFLEDGNTEGWIATDSITEPHS